MQITVRYGRGTQTARLDPKRLVGETTLPAPVPIDDIQAALESALSFPAGPPLESVVRPGSRVLVMTVDHTRPNPSPVLWPLMERIESLGGRPELMIGLGNHRAMTADELEAFLGIRHAHQNESRSPDQWRLGVTTHGTPIDVSPVLREFDVRIVVGFIEPHYIAGFSGGRKMILPACASRPAITHNHFLTALHGPQLGRLEGNLVHDDMLQAARAVGVHWICDVVVNPDDTFHSIHCGDLEAAHRQGAEAARRLYTHRVARRADIVICSSGGWPYDVDMVQAKKTLAPALECVRPGGAVILVGECPRGWGATPADRDLLSPESALPTRGAVLTGLRQGCVDHDWAACSPGLLFLRVVHDVPAQLIVVSSLGAELAGTYLNPAPDLETALGLAEELLGADSSVLVLHDGRRTICIPPGNTAS